MSDLLSIINFSLVSLAPIVLCTLLIMRFVKLRPIVWGIVAGIVLAVINTFVAGILGFSFAVPLLDLIKRNNSLCTGDGCWGTMIIIGDIGFVIIMVTIGFLISKIKNRHN